MFRSEDYNWDEGDNQAGGKWGDQENHVDRDDHNDHDNDDPQLNLGMKYHTASSAVIFGVLVL